MPGDYSRKTFRQNKHYSGVLMQQGRVQLDADWNEQLDIQSYRTHTEALDVIGQSGAPQDGGGFKIGVTPDGKDLTISPGRLYVEGLLCELDSPSTYITQPHLPNPEFTTVVTSPDPATTRQLDLDDGHYMVYLDAWQQERTALDDALIREVALGGPDTTTRIQNVWQVKLLRMSGTEFRCSTSFNEFDTATAASTGKLNAKTVAAPSEEDPCLLPPTSGYKSLENQLYRVEIHSGSQVGGPIRFKWSRDNASIETSIVSINNAVATVIETGKDALLAFQPNQWVELVDEESTLKGQPRALIQIETVQHETREITFKTSLTSFANLIPGLKLRRWDQLRDADENGLIVNPDVWLELEHGIQVQFSPGTYRPGDYWLIPARTATGEIEWPPFKVPNTEPLPQPPLGVHHHYCRLAILKVSGGVILQGTQDCRSTFAPLTKLRNFFYGGGTGQEAAPGEELPCPLVVVVTNGIFPVPFVRVKFGVGAGAGALHTGDPTNVSAEVIVDTDNNGLAWCKWVLPMEQIDGCLQVRATLVDNPFPVMLHFNANFSKAATVEERGIVVVGITSDTDSKPIENDSLVSVTRLLKGLRIECDQEISTLAGGGPPSSLFPNERSAGKPTCFVTLDLPYPIGRDREFWGITSDFAEIVGFQPLILSGDVRIENKSIIWAPSKTAHGWLNDKLFQKFRIPVENIDLAAITDRILAHLTIKGNFVFSSNVHTLNLDGDAFGRPSDNERIGLDLPSGDKRRGGDLDMWFWLTPRRLTMIAIRGADNVRGIKGSLLSDEGKPVQNVEVKLVGPTGASSTTATDVRGEFRFNNLVAGVQEVSVQTPDFSASESISV